MKNPKFIRFLSTLVNISSGLLLATIILYFQNWFGSGDTFSYVLWTIPLAIGIAFFGNKILNYFKFKKLIFRCIYILIISLLISVGWTYSVYLILGPWINAFSIPVFLLWIVGVFSQLLFLDYSIPLNYEKIKIKNFIKIIIGFPLIIISCLSLFYGVSLFYSYVNRPDAETYLIPKGFAGEFKVVYGEDCGIEPKIENDRKVYEIPENGILIIKPEFKSGKIDHEYYFIDKKGNRTKINQYNNYVEGTTNIPGVALGGSGSMGSGTNPMFKYTDFKVHADTTDNYNYKLAQQFDSLALNIVSNCRKLK